MTDKDKKPEMCHARSPSGNRTPPRRRTPTPASDDNARMSSDQIEDEASVMAEEMVSKLTQDQIRDLAEALQKDLASEKTKAENADVSEESETSKASDAAIIDPSWILDNSGGRDVTAGDDDDVYVSPEDRFTVNELKLKMEKSADKKKFVSSTADKGLLALEHDYCDAEKKLAKDESKVTEAKRVLRSSTRPTETRKEEKSRKKETENKEEDIDIDGGEDKAENDDKVVEKTKRGEEEEEHEDDKDKGKSDKESEKGKDDDEEEEEEDDDEEEEGEDNSLYCICRKPHQNRFMICCDRCQEWYHGDCVGISVERGQEMDMNDEEYVCPKCQRKAKDRKLLREKAMQSKKRELEKRSGKHELRRRDAPVLETVQSEMRNQKALTRTRIGGRRSTLADYDEDDEWVPWRPQPQDDEEEVSQEKKSKSTLSSSSRICLNPSCKKLCRGDTLYCSEECIKKYARSALNQLAQIAAHQKSTSFSAQVAATGPAADRVTVFDRSAGRSVGGMAAPKRENLASWLVSHPMCEVAFKSGGGMGGQSQKDSKPKESRLSRSDSLSDDHKPKMSMNVKLVRNNVVKSLKQILLERQKADRVKVDEKDVQLISQKIEKQLYRIHDGVGQKYKAKYRTLMFNLKDIKNSVLYKDVLAGRLKPAEIVRLSSEELASKELAKWRQEENKKTLELIKASELEAAKEKIKITKMTHKGEIEIEEINLGKSTSEPTPAPSVVDVLSVDTTAQHQSHVFSVNCRICTGKEEAPRIVKKKNDKPNDRERRERQIEEKPQPDYDVVMDVDVNPPSPLPLVPPELPEWKGVVNMQGVAKFIATANVVSGSISKKALSAMLPDSCSVQGRIAAGQVWDYVKKLKYSTNRDVCLIRFEPGSGDEKRSFLELFTYMKEKQRFVVVVNCHLPIKDMYLMPLSTGESLPNFLKPFHGPGLPRDRSDLIIGIIVKQSSKQRRHHGNSGTSSRESHRHHHQHQHQHQHRSKSSRKHHHHHQTVPDEAPINLAKKGYFQVSSSLSSSSTAALGRNSPPADVRYSPSTEVYSPSQPSLDDDDVPSGQTESTTKPSSAVSAILSVAMARAGGGGGGGLSASTTNRTEIPLLGGDSTSSSGGTSIPLLGDTTAVRLPAQTASSSSVSVESAEPPPVFSSSLMQAVKAMSSDTLQNIAQAVGFMKNQNPTPLEDSQRSPQQLTASSDNSPPPQLPPAPLPSHRSPPLEHMPDSISYESRPSDPRQKSAPISVAVSDPRRPPNWETDSPPPPQQPRKRTRWNDNDEERVVGGGTITKATRWEEDKEPLQPPPQPLLPPRRSRWEPQEELVPPPPPPPPPPLPRSGLLPLPPEDQRLDRGDLGYEFEMERRFDPPSAVAQQPPSPPPPAQFRDVDPRFDDMGGVQSFPPPPAVEERVDPSLYMQPTEEAMMRGDVERYPPGERERRLMPEGRLDWDREAEERRRYEEEEESKWEDPADEIRRSKMPKEMREYIEATKRELRESTVADQDRERRGLPLGYQSARRELEERKDRGHSRYREGDRYGGDPRWEREGYYRDEGRPRRP